MEKKKPQQMRFNPKELELIKGTFAENETLLKAMRKLFLQLALTKTEEKDIHNAFDGKPDLQAVVAKVFLPEIEGDAPFYQVVDLFMTVDIKDKSPMEAESLLLARVKLVAYLKEQLTILFGGSINGGIVFASLIPNKDKETQDMFIDAVMRNTLVSHIEQQLNQLFVLGGQKNESTEETMKRLAKDSMK